MPLAFKAGELSQGEAWLLDWVGKKFGEGKKFTAASAIQYYGKVAPDSEGVYGVQNRIGHIMGEKLSNRGMGQMAVGSAGLPVMIALAIAGVAAAPILAVGAAAAAIGVALKGMAQNLGEKLAARRMLKALADPAPAHSPQKFSI